MVDFKKRLGKQAIEKKANPVEIYEELDRKSETGPLRPVQAKILSEWWDNRKGDKDLILKLPTGHGKTLIGLLILQSQLNQKKGPCLYVCPNKHLVEQTCREADKFGIGHVQIGLGSDNLLPEEFLNSEKILITNIQKVFNGKSKFGIGGNFQKVDTIVLDDSHACIDCVKDAFKIEITKNNEIYLQIFQLFEEYLQDQGEGSFLEIKEDGNDTYLPVPYWIWEDKKQEVVEILGRHKQEKEITFAWPLVKDRIGSCQCFISGKTIEITPFISPVDEFGTFSKANHRILMSATTQNDSFFIKDFGFNIESVKNPLTHKSEKWWGEKMILIPSLIREELERNKMIPKFAQSNSKREFGIVVITTSFKRAEIYKSCGATICKPEDIFENVNNLKIGESYSNTLVLANRYDGIDLPDDSCRILIIDSLPYANCLSDEYEKECRSNSALTNIQIAQKIEQGLGRSVRGEKDYSVIILLGNDLIQFVKSKQTSQFFSMQTKKQIEIGLEIATMAKEENEEQQAFYKDPLHSLTEVINQCLQRDEGWKEFYREKMNSITQEEDYSKPHDIINMLDLERKAAECFYKNDIEKAVDYIQKLIDTYCHDNTTERGWYLQILARYKYTLSKVESTKIQKSAYGNNTQLLKPRDIIYKKLNYINESRVQKIKNWITSQSNYQELMLNVDAILDNLIFGHPSEKSEKFEKALQDLGEAIGFQSERPDRQFKKGPDNLWCIAINEYVMFECKSQVEDNRSEINKTETGQMNNHCAWFEQEYNTSRVTRILIIPTKNVSNQGGFTHDVKIMRKNGLNLLKNKVKGFFKELRNYDLNAFSDSKIQELLEAHNLDINSIKGNYCEDPYQRR